MSISREYFNRHVRTVASDLPINLSILNSVKVLRRGGVKPPLKADYESLTKAIKDHFFKVKNMNSVGPTSTTEEIHAFVSWCTSQLAKPLGNDERALIVADRNEARKELMKRETMDATKPKKFVVKFLINKGPDQISEGAFDTFIDAVDAGNKRSKSDKTVIAFKVEEKK